MPNGSLSASSSLASWLSWQESAHNKEIDLGLARVLSVYNKLACDETKQPFTITVAGTNGKGSSVALLESVLLSAGYSVGSYTTPHLIHYNERIRVNGVPVVDEVLCQSFANIDQARAETSLSYFEFGTLAALDIFGCLQLDVQILEVGLGGRLDAVNIIDADAALITTIGVDHIDWLGSDIAQIAIEKAGVLRPHQPSVCSDANVPSSLVDYAKDIKANISCAGKDFSVVIENTQWLLKAKHKFAGVYPLPLSKGTHQIHNAAGVISLLAQLDKVLPVGNKDLLHGLNTTVVVGRSQLLAGSPNIILDVAHNAQSAQAFASFVESQQSSGAITAVFSILADKDIKTVLEPFLNLVDNWAIAPLDTPRGEHLSVINAALASQLNVEEFASIEKALESVKGSVNGDDLIICFGSFYLVEGCLRAL